MIQLLRICLFAKLQNRIAMPEGGSMEIVKDEKTKILENRRRKGGLRTMPFIIANETFEKVAGIGLQANMIIYLQDEYHLSNAAGATMIFLWQATSHFTPILGAFFSDSFLGRFRVITIGTFVSLIGMIVLWLTAIIPGARPPHCADTNHLQNCVSANAGQLLFLSFSFLLMSIGAGGIRPCSLAFGADQLHNPDNPKNERVLQSFFNWYYASVGISFMFSVILIVSIQNSKGWVVGFGVPVGFMLFSLIMFIVGSSLYIKVKANKSMLTGFAQVFSAARKNRHLALPPLDSESWYCQKGSKLIVPTEQIGYLNKACYIKDPDKNLDSNGNAIDPWNLCTVKQVEEIKALIRVLPIWSTGIMVAVTLSQHAFAVIQAETMDRHFIGKAKIPAGSYGVFTILSLTIWVAIYDRILVRFIAKFTKRPRGLTHKQRIGTGLVLSCLATALAGLVEHQRRKTAISSGFSDQPKAVVNMSASWLIPQHCLTGLAEAFNAIGQLEFYYSQFPKTMSSIAVALLSLGFAIGNLVGSLIVAVLSHATRGKSRVSWVSNNLNRAHFDYYYWVLASLSVLNFLYYLVCSKAYGSDEDKKIWDDEDNEDRDGGEEPKNSHVIHGDV